MRDRVADTRLKGKLRMKAQDTPTTTTTISGPELNRCIVGCYCLYVGLLLICLSLTFLYLVCGGTIFDHTQYEGAWEFMLPHMVAPAAEAVFLIACALLAFFAPRRKFSLLLTGTIALCGAIAWFPVRLGNHNHMLSHALLGECSGRFGIYPAVLKLAALLGGIMAVWLALQKGGERKGNPPTVPEGQKRRPPALTLSAFCGGVVLLNFVVVIPTFVHLCLALIEIRQVAEGSVRLSREAITAMAKQDERFRILCELFPELEEESTPSPGDRFSSEWDEENKTVSRPYARLSMPDLAREELGMLAIECRLVPEEKGEGRLVGVTVRITQTRANEDDEDDYAGDRSNRKEMTLDEVMELKRVMEETGAGGE